MLKIVSRKTSNKYNGNVNVTETEVNNIERIFNSKYEAFKYGIENNWNKKCIMKYCLETERDQYFYNYLNKYLSDNK